MDSQDFCGFSESDSFAEPLDTAIRREEKRSANDERIRAAIKSIQETASMDRDAVALDVDVVLGDLLARGGERTKWVTFVMGDTRVAVLKSRLAKLASAVPAKRFPERTMSVSPSGLRIRWKYGKAGLDFYGQDVSPVDAPLELQVVLDIQAIKERGNMAIGGTLAQAILEKRAAKEAAKAKAAKPAKTKAEKPAAPAKEEPKAEPEVRSEPETASKPQEPATAEPAASAEPEIKTKEAKPSKTSPPRQTKEPKPAKPSAPRKTKGDDYATFFAHYNKLILPTNPTKDDMAEFARNFIASGMS